MSVLAAGGWLAWASQSYIFARLQQQNFAAVVIDAFCTSPTDYVECIKQWWNTLTLELMSHGNHWQASHSSTRFPNASWIVPGSVQPHQSVIRHLFAGLSWGRSPSTIPSITIFTSYSSFVPRMRPNSFVSICFSKSVFMHCLYMDKIFAKLLMAVLHCVVWDMLHYVTQVRQCRARLPARVCVQ